MLRIIGGLFVLYQLASRAANSLLSQIEYSFKPIQKRDLSIVIEDSKLIGKLRIHLVVQNKGGVNLTAESLQLQISQQSSLLGQVLTTNPVQIPAKVEKELSFDLNVPAGEFLDRLDTILKQGITSAVAPLDIKGILTLNGGQQIPINRQIKFFAVS